jgi:tetratricopeptide (TPR) repeat protein
VGAEELNADATALDLCYALDLQGKTLWEFLLSSDEEAALPEQHKSNILNADGTQTAAEFFFNIMHLLDVFFARAFNLWVPFKTHPPSVVRMVFSRCIFRPPEIKIYRQHIADEPQVMINFSNVLLGGLSKLPDGIHPIALSRLTDQTRNEILFQNLCYYVRHAYSDNLKTTLNLRLKDIVVIEDPVFQSDRLLTFTNLLCSLVEDLMKDIPGSSLDNGVARQSEDNKRIEELLKKGISLVRHSRMNDALRIFQEVLAKDANNRDALLYTGIAFGYIGQYEQSLSYLERAETVTEVVSRRTLAELATYKASALAKLGRHREAMTLFDKAISYDEKHTWAWYSKGIAFSDNGELEQALDCFSKALELEPLFPDGWRDKGLVLANMGRLKQALACYDKALSIDPKLVAAWHSRGNALVQMDRLREALESYEKVVELDPSYESALHNRNVLRPMLEGSAPLEEAVIRDRLDEGSVDERLEQEKWSWVEKGMALDGIDEWKQAIDCYDKALQIDHKFAAACSHKGNSLAQMGANVDALECFKRALEIDGEYARAWVGKGDVLSNSFLDDKGGVILNFSDRKDILAKVDILREAIHAYKNFIAYASPDLSGYKKAIEARCGQIEAIKEFLLKSLERI